MKVNKGLVEDVKGTVNMINSNRNNIRPSVSTIIRNAYLININDCIVSTISDLMCHPDDYSFEGAASIMAIANKYAFQDGVQSPKNIDMAIGVWITNNGFDESSVRQAKMMSELYKKMWDASHIICIFGRNVNLLIED